MRRALRLVITCHRLHLLLLHEVELRLHAPLPRELSESVRPAEWSHHATAVHVWAFIVMIVPSFTFELLVEAAAHRVLAPVPSKRYVMDSTMRVHMRLLVQLCGCLAVRHARQGSIELADGHGRLVVPLSGREGLIVREAVDFQVILVKHFEVIFPIGVRFHIVEETEEDLERN